MMAGKNREPERKPSPGPQDEDKDADDREKIMRRVMDEEQKGAREN